VVQKTPCTYPKWEAISSSRAKKIEYTALPVFLFEGIRWFQRRGPGGPLYNGFRSWSSCPAIQWV